MMLGRLGQFLQQAVLLLLLVRAISSGGWGSVFGNSWDPELGFPEPPDYRPRQCRSLVPDTAELEGLRSTIIIPYRNEPWEHMEMSVKSILHYTPHSLIETIMFVSDGNTPEATYADQLRNISSLITVLEFSEPVGLISAKMQAVEAAPKTPVLIFLEPHIRVNRDWLQPLLNRIRQHPRALVMPAMDIIPQEDFLGYNKGNSGYWRFEWNLNLIFTNAAGYMGSEFNPIPSPATSGGIFAIRRDWWDHLGLYDPGMTGWGGDHLEASHKVWRCGGRIEVVPCARVGHRFRDPEHRPYDVDVNQVVHNYARFAKVWLDDKYPSFVKMKPEVKRMDVGDVSGEVEERQRLTCKNMSWYISNIDLELGWEESRICIPGCKIYPPCCADAAPAAPGRSTIDQVMPRKEYKRLRSFVPIDSAVEEPTEL